MTKDTCLAIDKPCTQNWATMEKTPTGRYCGSCNHEVLDFTTWPEDKILAFISQAKGKVCGRLRPGQCRPNLSPSRKPVSFLRSPFLIAASVLSLGTTSALRAQDKVSTEIVPALPAKNTSTEKEPVAAGTPTQSNFTIQGRLVDKDEAKPVPGVTVLLVGTDQGTTADVHGRFKLEITGNQHDQVKLAFAYIGYDTVYKIVSLEKEITDLGTISVTENPVLLGEVAVVRYNLPGFWQRVLHTFKRK
jgi:hypothetical protein